MLNKLRKLIQNNNAEYTFHSTEYWENRYKNSGNSGPGSYGNLATFKADQLNTLITDYAIESVIEWGCGDGNQLSLYQIKDYLGVDVSETALEICRQKFSNAPHCRFMAYQEAESKELKYGASISIDVIFHLVEEDVFNRYMNNLFSSASQLVIIYSSNTDIVEEKNKAVHVKHRKFTDWVSLHQPDWTLETQIKNKFPFDGNYETSSFCDFFVFRKQ